MSIHFFVLGWLRDIRELEDKLLKQQNNLNAAARDTMISGGAAENRVFRGTSVRALFRASILRTVL